MIPRNVQEVAEWRLCVGCGACAYVCPEGNVKLVDVVNDGIRPVIKGDGCASCDDCVKVCPGYDTTHPGSDGSADLVPQLIRGWGTVLEVWEGYASDPEVRYNGASGGLVSAISLYCMEKADMHGTLHIGVSDDEPWRNKTFLSRDRSGLLSRTGSRYSPASPCDGLAEIESAPAPCVFVGKPCDIAGLRKTQHLRPGLDGNIGLAIGFFCAGTPATLATFELLRNHNIDRKDVAEVRYRGRGWPGMFTVQMRGKKHPGAEVSYMESWGFLQKYRPFRCYLCPDGTSEFADISCGDPWYREAKDNDSGCSLVLVRTERGRKALRGAMEAGYVSLKQSDPKILHASQSNLLLKRSAIWGRLVAMKTLGVPIPKLRGFHLFRCWLSLSVAEKARSILGTVRRIIQRSYYKKRSYT